MTTERGDITRQKVEAILGEEARLRKACMDAWQANPINKAVVEQALTEYEGYFPTCIDALERARSGTLE